MWESPPDHGPLDQSWLEPLDLIAKAIAGNDRYKFFDLSDFMIMAKVHRKSRPTLVLYKHVHTRRYVNVDAGGHTYRYIAARKRGGSGRYVAHRDLRTALDALDLWELPWMKAGLEEHRRGLPWSDRWLLHPDEEPFDPAAYNEYKLSYSTEEEW